MGRKPGDQMQKKKSAGIGFVLSNPREPRMRLSPPRICERDWVRICNDRYSKPIHACESAEGIGMKIGFVLLYVESRLREMGSFFRVPNRHQSPASKLE